MDDELSLDTLFDVDMEAHDRESNITSAAMSPEAYEKVAESFGDEGNKNNLLVSRPYSINEILGFANV